MTMMSLAMLLMVLIPRMGAFNLEPRIPVIKNGPTPGSYFGYSVAQHQSVSSETGTIMDSW